MARPKRKARPKPREKRLQWALALADEVIE
jgi:hypothetical protein